jgi:hypothetical protein
MTRRLFFFAYCTSSGCTYVPGLYHNFFFLQNSGNLAPSTSSSNDLHVIGSQDGISLCLLIVEVVHSQLCLNIKLSLYYYYLAELISTPCNVWSQELHRFTLQTKHWMFFFLFCFLNLKLLSARHPTHSPTQNGNTGNDDSPMHVSMHASVHPTSD